MKKTVLTFGLISGAVSSLLMVATMPFMDRIGFDKGYVIGYTSIVLSFMLVYFGIRSYRDNVTGGHISFGKAFQVGILITLISCACYMVTWEVLSHTVVTDFLDKYNAYLIEKAKSSGATAEALQKQAEEMARFKELYENPFINAALTLLEPLPVGLVITIISSFVLKKKGP
jgi:hypothetical protein